jgi:ankyrin repeat protein
MKRIFFVFLLFFNWTVCAMHYDAGNKFVQAALLGDIETLSSLCNDNKVDVNFQNEYGLTALMVVVYCGRKDLAEVLVDKGADVDVQNKYGNTALMYACSRDWDPLVTLLIARGAQLNIQNAGGWTALMHAISFGTHDEVVRELCESGANIAMQDDEGNTALMLAQACGRDAIVEYIRSFGT